ncbi:MAG: FtsW/RodA/SpoVE family cell cycle protein [Gammaproteobacteria bacterium]|nr:FtsW/RodA/SpoVE family cell cycle protein [Gammaproteobacteria bacterium]MBU1655376.1 FtsW/RodA/SpoVE family cell cycle protein [Gammaproteobacteria bacterium]MBU1960354.1 FtsW/RodA/SpoVE family cell cycle protein [Gammaproteobacteria bacterium]
MGNKARTLPLITLGLWALFVLLGHQLILNAPQVWLTERLLISPSPGQSIELGRTTLGLTAHDRTTASRHLQITRDGGDQKDLKSGIRFFNISPLHRVDARTERFKTRFIKRLPLSSGDSIHLGARVIQVVEADPGGRLVLAEDQGDRVVWEGGRLLSQRYPPFKSCGMAWFKRQARDLRWWLRDKNREQELTLFSLGGRVQCLDRWRLSGVPTTTAQIYWRDGRFLLGSVDRTVREQVVPKGAATGVRLAGQWLPLDGAEGLVNRLVLGRTHFRVSGGPDRLALEPERNIPVVFEPPPAQGDTPGLMVETRSQRWIGDNPFASLSPWRAGLLVFFIFLSLPAAALLHAIDRQMGQYGRSRVLAWLALLPAWGLLGFALVGWSVLNNNLAWGLLPCALAWLIATLQLLQGGRLRGPAGLLWLLLTLLAGIGALNLTQLAAGAYNTKWLGYASGHLAVLTGMAAAVALLGRLPPQVLRRLAANFIGSRSLLVKLIKGGFVLMVIGLAFYQFVTGDEKGLGWIQPVEFVKLILVFMLATTLTHLRWLRIVESRDYRENRLRWIAAGVWVVIVFFLAAGVLMLGVNDYSPIVIVLTLMLPFLWLAFADPHVELTQGERDHNAGLLRDGRLLKRVATVWGLRGMLLLLLGGIVLTAYYLYKHPPDYLSSFPQAERLRIWSNPWAHRLSGDQVIQSLLRVREGGWSGVSDWFGGNGKVMNLPAVQDDFIAAFLINRFGAFAALLLVAVQALWFTALLRIADRLMSIPGEFEEYRSRYWLGGVLTGLAWMQITHWAISWGNVLGLLPVMGQPMSWLSSGNSHMLAIGFTSMALAMVGAWIVGEGKLSD